MRYEVEDREPDIEIRVVGAGGQASRLLESMQECRSGRCGCPTDQYDKLEAMDVDAGEGVVTVRLHPLPGERLDLGQIRTCLDYTTMRAEQ